MKTSVHNPHSSLDALFPLAKWDPEAPWLEVSQYWGDMCLETQHFRPGQAVSTGDRLGWRWSFLGVDLGWVSPRAAMVLPYLPPVWSEVTPKLRAELHIPGAAPCDLAHWDGEHWVLHTPRDARALVDGELQEADPIEDLPLCSGRTVELHVGQLRIVVRSVPRAAALERGQPEVDAPFSVLLSTFAAFAVLLGITAWLAPPPPETTLVELSDSFVELALAAAPKEKKIERPVEPKAADPEVTQRAAEATPAEGKRGKGPKDKKADRPMARKIRDRAIAENAGLLGAIRDSGLDRLLGSGSLGDELVGAAHGLALAKGGGGPGGFGLGERGLSRGGSIDGLGDVWGGGGGPQGREGYGPQGTKREGGPLARTSDPLVVGSLDRSQVDEVVKRHLSAIRYCYQRELQREPNLSGKVVVKFVISGDGSVSSSTLQSSSLGHAGAEQCVVDRFLRMSFPEPRGSGMVVVKYPFLFSPS